MDTLTELGLYTDYFALHVGCCTILDHIGLFGEAITVRACCQVVRFFALCIRAPRNHLRFCFLHDIPLFVAHVNCQVMDVL